MFAGTPPFAAIALEAIAAAGHDVALVLTQPDRPAGRGLHLTASAVSQSATRLGLDTDKPPSLKDEQVQRRIHDAQAQVMVVAAYGLLLPKAVLQIPPRGCINIHASLLPRWRGAAPVHRALLEGDAISGVSIMQMDEGLDTGPLLLCRELAIGARATTGSLTQALADLGASAIVDALAHLSTLRATPQPAGMATYAAKISKAEARIDWTRSSAAIDRQVRAFDPAPGAESMYAGEVVKIWRCEPMDANGAPGEVLAAQETGIVIACGTGALRLSMLQRPGGRRLAAADWLRGNPVPVGARLG